MSLEGDLTVRLAWDGRRVLRVDIASTRPLIAGRLVVNAASSSSTLEPDELEAGPGPQRESAVAVGLDARLREAVE